MKTYLRILTTTLTLSWVGATIMAPAVYAQSAEHKHGAAQSSASDSKEWRAQAKAAYPLDTCVVSGDKLGEMGTPVEYVHKEEGKPDRLVLLCCKGCIRDFKKSPEQYLKKLDAAVAAKTGAGKP